MCATGSHLFQQRISSAAPQYPPNPRKNNQSIKEPYSRAIRHTAKQRRNSAPGVQTKYIENGHQYARGDMESLVKPPSSEKRLRLSRVSRVDPEGGRP